MDQRCTGRSHRIDDLSDAADLSVERLKLLRQDNIVRDADQGERQSFLTGVRNALREELPSYMIPDRWSVFPFDVTGNSSTIDHRSGIM